MAASPKKVTTVWKRNKSPVPNLHEPSWEKNPGCFRMVEYLRVDLEAPFWVASWASWPNITGCRDCYRTDEWDIVHLIFEGKGEDIFLEFWYTSTSHISKYHMTTTKIISQHRHMILKKSTLDNISLSASKHPHPLVPDGFPQPRHGGWSRPFGPLPPCHATGEATRRRASLAQRPRPQRGVVFPPLLKYKAPGFLFLKNPGLEKWPELFWKKWSIYVHYPNFLKKKWRKHRGVTQICLRWLGEKNEKNEKNVPSEKWWFTHGRIC